MIVVACPWLQVLTELKVDKLEISTDGETAEIWLLVRPELALPRDSIVSAVTVWILDASAADTCKTKYIH